MSILRAGAFFACLIAAPAAQAQVLGVDEVRGGVFAHSADDQGSTSLNGMFDISRIEDANVELLFTVPGLADIDPVFGTLRPHIGATLNTAGRESMVYAGLSWTYFLFDSPLFVEGSFGGALHNGASTGAVYPLRNLGCSPLFRESASVGYAFSAQASMMLTIEHASHAFLCGPENRGLTNVGVRFGYSF